MPSRSVESPHYHIWTDALRGRDLALRATDSWDRGTFARWSLMSAWTAFERVVENALGVTSFGSNFWRNFDRACSAAGITPPQRGHGPWQRVAAVHSLRRQYVHLLVTDQNDLLPADAESARDVIIVLRDAVKDLYAQLGSPAPDWIDDDRLPEHPAHGHGALTIGHNGVNADDADTVRVSYQYRDRVSVSDILPAGTDPTPYMENVIKNILIPISAVRAYRGDTLIEEILIRMRGVEQVQRCGQ